MPIDMTQEELLTLSGAAKALPLLDGKRPHTSTIFRWITHGVQGVKLEHVRVGRRICTSRQALVRFSQALATAEPVRVPSPRISRPSKAAERQKAIESAEQQLAAEGV